MIRLLPLTAAALEAAARDPAAFARAHGFEPGAHGGRLREVAVQTATLPAEETDGVFWGGYLALEEPGVRHASWGGHLVREESGIQPVGTCAFTGPPEADGAVEIAYFTFPGNEGRGIGTEMARELLALASSAPSVRRVIAHTLLEPGASSRILEKLGFAPDGETDDPDAGRVRRWVLERVAGDEAASSRELVEVFSSFFTWEAHLVAGRLTAEGFQAEILDAETVRMNWVWSHAIGGCKVAVPESEAAAAKAAMTRLLAEAAEVEAGARRCAACGGAGRRAGVGADAAVSVALFVLLNVPAPLSRRLLRCEQCGAEWVAGSD